MARLKADGQPRKIDLLGLAVRKQLSRGKIQGFLTTASSRLAVKQASEDLELSIEGLNVGFVSDPWEIVTNNSSRSSVYTSRI